MPYLKAIQSGNVVETWQYERAPALKFKSNKPRVKRLPSRQRRIDSIKACKLSFTRLVRANLTTREAPALMTLTFAANEDIEHGYKAYTAFWQRLRRHFGSEIAAIGVPEFQGRGAVHFHVLIWGLPSTLPCILSKSYYYDSLGKKRRKHVCPKGRLCERSVRRIAGIWGQGYADLVQTDGDSKLSSYMAKYMSKAMYDERLRFKRAYSASRNVLRPVSLNTPFSISTAFTVWGLEGVDNACVSEKEYGTLYLGRCVYKQFVIPNHEITERSHDAVEGGAEGGHGQDVR